LRALYPLACGLEHKEETAGWEGEKSREESSASKAGAEALNSNT